MTPYHESHLEEAVFSTLSALGWQHIPGVVIAPGEPTAERADYAEVILNGRLVAAVARLNPGLPSQAHQEALRQVRNLPSLHPSWDANNRAFHKLLVEGVDVSYKDKDGALRIAKVELVDFANPERNDFLAVNQFTIRGPARARRIDVLLYINGMPIGLIELKSPADAKATLNKAYKQLQTYKEQIPKLFVYNELCVLSDGVNASLGTHLTPPERFMPWRTVDGVHIASVGVPSMETLVQGALVPAAVLDLLRHFISFDVRDNGGLAKRLAAYHQVHAANAAVLATLGAVSQPVNRRIGVVWHTQGSGKSLTMLFYAGKIIAQPEMENPTLVVVTDRNDLDGQLYDTFKGAVDLLRQTPQQASDRTQLKELLRVSSGGVVFTTAQKFLPEKPGQNYGQLSERKNIIVIADEAHRSQYGFVDGFARHLRDALPNAAFIGFSGTPVELDDRNTINVFGDYISIYDIEQAIQDKVTVPILYEARFAKINLPEEEKPRLEAGFEEIVEDEEDGARQQLTNKWTRMEAIAGTPKRLKLLAEDIIAHFEARQGAIRGKGMVVCMSRRIAVDLYNQIIALRPEWHSEDVNQGAIKVVMTGSASDPVEWQQHILPKSGRKRVEERFKNPVDQLQLVIVRDMWLTGFDVPSMHTMYLDKPMRGHTLMQAIARVNRVFKDKPGGLVVDYLGIGEPLKEALAIYANSGGKGQAVVDQREAVRQMMAKYEVVKGLFEGFDYSRFIASRDRVEQHRIAAEALNFILSDVENGKARFVQHVAELSAAFALSVTQPETLQIRDDLMFFQMVRASLIKYASNGIALSVEDEAKDLAVRQMIASAVTPDGVMDIFEAAGLPKPDISILSDAFLMGIQNLPQKNLALEMLRKLLNDELKTRERLNMVQARFFADKLEETVRRYQARSIEAAQVIIELIEIARELRHADERGEKLRLTQEELAFYDALSTNSSARDVMGDNQLSIIAREVLQIVRENTTIDWTEKEGVKANLRRYVKRVLRKYGYPPDMQESATQTVLQQAELLASDWS
ncbi:MAG TPA: type I restriction endonuclease subunit R [Anaerolineales bacterium]|nr:type I restriction endonuclease subunit R [Anaerolineales bacterium]HRQ93372.1 type I restriction endonuclease subunit R [Anaerolineales bacterium]